MVSFDNFRTLDPETADLTRELMNDVSCHRSAFNSFLNLWMGFNGWMECVTEVNTDADMIGALADNQRVINAYDDLMRRSADFRQAVMTFSAMWPVLNVRDVRKKLGRDAFWRFSREGLLDEALRRGVKHQPTGWTGGDIPTWSQLFRTIYGVRCNLFHGTKSPQNYRDRELVLSCDYILRMFIDHTGCLEWHD